MRRYHINAVVFALLLVLLAAMGCNKSSAPPAPLAMEQLPLVFEKAFRKAKPQVKELAAQVVSSVQTNGYAQAYSDLQKLSTAPELTKEQSSVVGRGMLTINGLLQSAAAKGDENAAQTVKAYRLNK